jgi:hypothetical protein
MRGFGVVDVNVLYHAEIWTPGQGYPVIENAPSSSAADRTRQSGNLLRPVLVNPGPCPGRSANTGRHGTNLVCCRNQLLILR